MNETVLRACCMASAECGRQVGFVETRNCPTSLAEHGAPVLAVAPPLPLSYSTAAHEAAHAVIGLLLGAEVSFARIGISASAGVSFPAGTPRSHNAIMFIAGPVAESWSNRWTVTASDADLAWHLSRVRACDLGSCDACRATFEIVAEDTKRTDEEVIARYRVIEAQTIEAVQRRDVWRIIREVAAALMETHELPREKIREIIAKHPTTLNL